MGTSPEGRFKPPLSRERGSVPPDHDDRRSVQLPGGKGVLALQRKGLRQKVGHRQTVNEGGNQNAYRQ